MSSFRATVGNERVNGLQTLQKSARHQLYPLFSSIRGKLTWKKTGLAWSEIFRLFVNTLTADDKFSRRNVENLRQEFQTPLSHKGKTFSGFLLHFWKVHEI